MMSIGGIICLYTGKTSQPPLMFPKWFIPDGNILAPSVSRTRVKSGTLEPKWRPRTSNFSRRRGRLSVAPPTLFTRVLTICSMASSAKRRAVGLGENPQESEHSSDENPEDEDDSGEEDSEASDEEINEVTERSSLHADSVHGLVS